MVSERTPAQAAQAQLDAYNAQDLEAFVACYAQDVEVYTHPATLTMRGREALREAYGALWSKAPALHARLTARLVQGRFVIDHEQVTGHPRGEGLTAVAIYEVSAEGLITRLWFIL